MTTSHQRSASSAGATPTLSSPGFSRPDEAVSVGTRRLAASLAEPAVRRRGDWLAVIGDCQSLINTVTAVQDMAIAEAARRESVWCEDGTLGETVHGPGRVTLDAADLVAPVIGASHPQAQRRVEQAVRLAAGRVPVPADEREVPEASGLRQLHEVMAAGQLDGYRAGVIAFELEVAPADVADAIVAALSGHFADDAAALRRRTRVLLARISPDLVRERAKRARAATGLRRWVAEPGVDEWHGTFPSEDAAAAWAAIDRLAHDLVAAGTCTNIEQARGKALTDLVTGNATIDVQVVLTVPADTGSRHIAAADTGSPHTVEASASAGPASPSAQHEGPGSGDHAAAAVSPATVAVPAPVPVPATVASQREAASVRDSLAPTTSVPDRQQTAADGLLTRGHDDDLVEVQGSRTSEPLLVRRGWLHDHLSKAPPRPRRGVKRASPGFVPCDPLTGARLDPDDHLTTDAYRPGDELAALVRARDGRCRFPGCSIAARSCDLDHVRPWPIGRTAARNLLTLCRRHHRIKQRPGWRLRLTPDGTATWSGPTGRERTTSPLNALQSLVLRADPGVDGCHTGADLGPECSTVNLSTNGPGPECSTVNLSTNGPGPECSTADLSTNGLEPELPGPPAGRGPVEADHRAWSALETHLELRLEHHPHQRPEHDLGSHPTHRRCTSAADLRDGVGRRRARAPVPDLPPF